MARYWFAHGCLPQIGLVICSTGVIDLGPSSPAWAQTPAIFAIDSTSTLFSFSSLGRTIAHTALPGVASPLCGGGMTLAGRILYVALCSPYQVAAFDAPTLQPLKLAGSFPGIDVPRGVAYDQSSENLVIGNGGPVNAQLDFEYSLEGINVSTPGGWPGYYGPSGVAWDPTNDTIWVSNYFGAAWSGTPEYGVSEYNEDGSLAATFNYATQFVPPSDPEQQQPYSIAYCPPNSNVTQGLVVVGFTSVAHVTQGGEVQSYSTSGIAMGAPFPRVTNANGLSCTRAGLVYVADETGLLLYSELGRKLVYPTGWFAGMKPPIFGVVAR